MPKLREKFTNIVTKSELQKEGKSQASICMAFRANPLNVKELVFFDLLTKILTGGLTGKLMLKLRDEMNLIYGISLNYINYPDTSMIYFQTNCKKDEAEPVLTSLENELKRLFMELSGLDIEAVANSLFYEIENSINAYEDVYFTSKTLLSNKKFITTEEYKNILKKTKISDVKKLYKKVFNKDKTQFVLK